MNVIDEIAAERKRQIDEEGWSAEHDDDHYRGELAKAAAAYTWVASLTEYDRRNLSDQLNGLGYGVISLIGWLWPSNWSHNHFKPTTPRRDLTKAAALIVAEIERLDRLADGETEG